MNLWLVIMIVVDVLFCGSILLIIYQFYRKRLAEKKRIFDKKLKLIHESTAKPLRKESIETLINEVCTWITYNSDGTPDYVEVDISPLVIVIQKLLAGERSYYELIKVIE